MMLFVPTTYQFIKAVLMVIILIMITMRTILQRGRLSLHPTILLWTLFVISSSLIFILNGVIHNTPGALRVGTVYVLWPLVFTFFVAGAASKKMIDTLFRVLVFATIAIGGYSLIFVLYKAGWWPGNLYVEINQGQSIGFYNGYIEYNLYSIATLIFTVPFLLASLLTWPKRIPMPVSRGWMWFALFLGIISVILSGRRGLWVIVMIAPIISVIIQLTAKKRLYRVLGKRIVLILLLVVIGYIMLQQFYKIDIMSLVDNLISSIDSSRNPGMVKRTEQFYALLNGFIESPLIGVGFGAQANVSYQLVDNPWAYELSYMALLFFTGLIGFLIYASGVVWIHLMGLKIIKYGNDLSAHMLPILVGTICFLLANATNPYLAKYDFMWVIFLPVAVINYWLISGMREWKNHC